MKIQIVDNGPRTEQPFIALYAENDEERDQLQKLLRLYNESILLEADPRFIVSIYLTRNTSLPVTPNLAKTAKKARRNAMSPQSEESKKSNLRPSLLRRFCVILVSAVAGVLTAIELADFTPDKYLAIAIGWTLSLFIATYMAPQKQG